MSAQYQTPDDVVANVPLASLRAICASDPNLCALNSTFTSSLKLNSDKENQSKSANANNVTTRGAAAKDGAKAKTTTIKEKKMTAREARRLIVAEIERLTVRAMIEHVTKPHVVEAVAALKIDHKGNCSTSRSVAAKRLFEHISTSTGGVGLTAYLEEEATEEFVADLLKHLPPAVQKNKEKDVIASAAKTLEHQAVVAFFESLPETLLHDICFDMKNERAQTETASRQMLVQSIVSNAPVRDLLEQEDEDKKKKMTTKTKKTKLSKKKPKLEEGVTYADVYQWYYLAELQEFARKRELKVSGTKRELILRILAFLETGETSVGRAKPKPKRKSTAAKKKKTTKKPTTEAAKEDDDEEEEEDDEENAVEEEGAEEEEKEEDAAAEEVDDEEDGEEMDE